jgi:hypothetical protein
VLYVTNAVGAGNACNDDACAYQSTVTAAIPAGAGLHTFVVDGYNATAFGAYTVAVTRP